MLSTNKVRKIYEKKAGFDTTDVNLMAELDEKILRQHEAVLKKKNKNIDMVENKIAHKFENRPELKKYMEVKIERSKLEEKV